MRVADGFVVVVLRNYEDAGRYESAEHDVIVDVGCVDDGVRSEGVR